MIDCKKKNLDLATAAIAAILVTAMWYAIVFALDFSNPKQFSGLPVIWTLLAGMCPLIGTVFAVLMLLMHRRGGRMNAALFYGTVALSLTPWLFWAKL